MIVFWFHIGTKNDSFDSIQVLIMVIILYQIPIKTFMYSLY